MTAPPTPTTAPMIVFFVEELMPELLDWLLLSLLRTAVEAGLTVVTARIVVLVMDEANVEPPCVIVTTVVMAEASLVTAVSYDMEVYEVFMLVVTDGLAVAVAGAVAGAEEAEDESAVDETENTDGVFVDVMSTVVGSREDCDEGCSTD